MLSLTTFVVLVVLAIFGLVGLSFWFFQEGQGFASEMQRVVSAKIIEKNRISAKTSVLETKYNDILNEQNIWLKQRAKWERSQGEFEGAKSKLEFELNQLKKELDLSQKMNSENLEALAQQESEMQQALKTKDKLEKLVKTLGAEKQFLVKEVELSKEFLRDQNKKIDEDKARFQKDLQSISQENEEKLHDCSLIMSGLKAEKEHVENTLKKQISNLQSQLNYLIEQSREVKQQDQEPLMQESRLGEDQERRLLDKSIEGDLKRFKYSQRLEKGLDEFINNHRIEVENKSRKIYELNQQIKKLNQEIDQSLSYYRLPIESQKEKMESKVKEGEGHFLDFNENRRMQEQDNLRLGRRIKRKSTEEQASKPDLSILKGKIDEARRTLYLLQSEEEFDRVG